MNQSLVFSPRGVLATLLLLSIAAGCRTHLRLQNGVPEVELEDALQELQDLRGGELRGKASVADAEREALLTDRIERLAFEHPDHPPTLVARAALAYERRDAVTAQRHLDQALRLDPTSVPATLLRVRIAAEQGNLPLARRKLDEQLALRPDEPALHEARAGLHYLDEDHELALEELALAERLGARDPWRLDYHRGLIFEAMSEPAEAQRYYRSCTEANPEFLPAARRERWLRERFELAP